MSEPSPSAPPASPRQVLLGLFILFQLTFMFVNNFLDFVKWAPSEMKDESKKFVNRLAPGFAEEQGHAWQWAEQVDTNTRRWVQLTGQDQAWSLFAPTVSKCTGFPAVVLSWDEPTDGKLPFSNINTFDPKNGFDFTELGKLPVGVDAPKEKSTRLMLSSNEPSDIHHYLRVGDCRVRRYEGQFYFNPQPYEKTDTSEAETPEALAERLSRRVKKILSEYHDPALEYLRWRLREWRKANPDQPAPTQVVLVQRAYRILGPMEGAGWEGPYSVPVARWQPNAKSLNLANKLEPFDFKLLQFVEP